MSKIPYNTYYNRDSVFFRRLLVGALASLNLRMSWENILEDNTIQKVEVPFYFSTTGDERFLVDMFLKPVKSDETGCVAETFYNQIPRGIVNFDSVSIDEGGLSNEYIRCSRIVDSGDGELKTFSSEVKWLPIDITLSIVCYCDSHLDILKMTETILDNFYKHIQFNIEHKGMRIAASMEFASDYSGERLVDFGYTDRKEFKVNFDIAVKSTYPIIKPNTTIFAGDTMGEIINTIFVGSTNYPQQMNGNQVITPPLVVSTIDQDVLAFVAITLITDTNFINALDIYVKFLKSNDLWDIHDAIYPFVGGNSFAHSINLKNPIDSDAAFRLTFFGGWTHDSNGVTPNGINAYANTFYTETINSQINNKHISIYSRTNAQGLYVDIGATSSLVVLSNTTDIIPRYLSGLGENCFCRNSSQSGQFLNNNSTGWFCNNRVSNTEIKFAINNTINTVPNVSIGLVPFSYYIGSSNAANVAAFRSVRNLAFASIGRGFTDTQLQLSYTAVQNLQIALNRQI